MKILSSTRWPRLVATVVFALLVFLQPVFAAGPLSARLSSEMSSEKTSIPVIIRFKNPPSIYKSTGHPASAERFISELHSTAQRSQSNAAALISKAEPAAKQLSLWIDNSIASSLRVETIIALSKLSEVELIDLDACDAKIAGAWDSPVPTGVNSTDTVGVAWNLKKTGVDSVWLQYGIDGTGVLVGHMDTGVDITHPALSGHMRENDGWFDAVNFRTTPYDDVGHGTGTIGVVIGGDGPGPFDHDIGIAYNAQFIATKMLAIDGSNPNSAVINGAQWILDPDLNPATNDYPSIVSNSWYSGTRGSTWFTRAAQAWRNVGIVPVFCAGNEGPAAGSTSSPGDYTICLSIGGTNVNDKQYSATSIGPSAEGPEFPRDGRKPDVSAPGEGVVSASKPASYRAMSGTSFSAPHAAGIIALVLQAAPELTFDQVKDVLDRSAADLGTAGYDYTFGYGRLDALSAVRYALGTHVSATPDTVTELNNTGGTSVFSFRLTTKPSKSVTIALRQSDAVHLGLSPSSITFTPDNWNVTQSVTATYAAQVPHDASVSITALFSSDDKLWNRILIPAKTVVLKQSGATSAGTSSDNPLEFSLDQNYPNPFNPSTRIPFTVAGQTEVTLKVYNILGEEVATLLQDQPFSTGTHAAIFSTGNSSTPLPSGIYYYSIRMHSSTGFLFFTRRMALIK